MSNLLKWETGTNSNFVAKLMMCSFEGTVPVLVIYKNEDCYSSFPTSYVDSYIRPLDVSFEEADIFIKENYGNLAPDELEENRLEYALKEFERDFTNQMNNLMGFA